MSSILDSLPDPRDPQDPPIWNAIESKDSKLALKLVEKKLSKKKDKWSQIIRFYVCCGHPNLIERGDASFELKEFENRDPIVDADVITFMDEGTKLLYPANEELWSKTVGTARFRAVQAKPKDEKLARDSLRACLKQGDLEHANQIVNVLAKNFPAVHKYVFWRVLILHILASVTPPPRNEIYDKLVLMDLKKLAGATKTAFEDGAIQRATLKSSEDETQNTAPVKSTAQEAPNFPVRSFHLPTELQFFHQVISQGSTPDETISFLLDECLGAESAIAKGEWVFHVQRLSKLKDLNKKQKIFELSKKLLAGSIADGDGKVLDIRGADLAIWDYFIDSAIGQSDEHLKVASFMIKSHLNAQHQLDKPYLKNARLARLKFLSATQVPGEYADDLVNQEALRKYFEELSAAEGGNGHAFSETYMPSIEKLTRNFPGVVAILEFLHEYHDFESTFDDIKQYAAALKVHDEVFLMQLLKYRWSKRDVRQKMRYRDLYLGVTISKLQYLYLSKAEVFRSFDSEYRYPCHMCGRSSHLRCHYCLEDLALECLKKYCDAISNKSQMVDSLDPLDHHPADGWSLIAAMCLLKIASDKNLRKTDERPYLQAAAILENAHQNSKANPQILLLQIGVYSLLGLGSLAYRAYNELGIKQVQMDTLSFVLFDRISSLHPHSFTLPNDAPLKIEDPIDALKEIQNLYHRAKSSVVDNMWNCLDNESYNALIEIMDVGHHFNSSITAAMSTLEARRISRIMGPNVEMKANFHDFDLIKFSKVSDKLDYGALPNFEFDSQVGFRDFVFRGSMPTPIRIRANMFVDAARTLISFEFPMYFSVAGRYKEAARLYKESTDIKACDLRITDAEKFQYDASIDAVSLVFWLSQLAASQGPHEQQSIEKGYATVHRNLRMAVHFTDKIDQEIPVYERALNPLYTMYDVACLYTQLLRVLNGSELGAINKGREKDSAEISRLAKSLMDAVLEKSKAFKKTMNGGGWMDRIQSSLFEWSRDDRENCIGRIIEEQFPEAWKEEWTGDALHSWRESVDGLAQLRGFKSL